MFFRRFHERITVSNSQPFINHLLPGCRYRINGKSYYLFASDREAIRRLKNIYLHLPQEPNPFWLLQFRDEIRAIVNVAPRTLLTYVILTCPDATFLKLAIWMRGLCGGTFGAPLLLHIAADKPNDIQLQVARALQRMGAWAQLHEMAHWPSLSETDSRFLPPKVRPQYASRLQRFLLNVNSVTVGKPSSEVFLAEQAGFLRGQPAKPLWLIRLVLDRIRFLVSSEYSEDRLPKYDSIETLVMPSHEPP